MSGLRRGIGLAGVLLAALGRAGVAQCDGACRVAILAIPAGTRGLGLGGAYVAGDTPDALFYNPAQVGSAHGSALSVTEIGGATFSQFASTGSAGGFGFGAGVRFLSRPTNVIADDSAALRGGALVAGVSLATQVHGIWLGGTANFVAPDLASDGGGVAFDLGAAVRRFGLLLGVSAQNLGRDLASDGIRQQLPTRVSLGAVLPATSFSTYFDFSASAALSVERGGVVVPRGGAELIYEPLSGWTITGRMGAQRPVDRPGELRGSAISLGGSLGLKAVSLDYTFQPAVAGGQAVQSLGIRVQ